MKTLLLGLCLTVFACGDSSAPSPDLSQAHDLSSASDLTAGKACDPKVSTSCPGTLLVCDAASMTCATGTACTTDAMCGKYKCGMTINTDTVCYQSCWAGGPQDSLCSAGHTCNASGACI